MPRRRAPQRLVAASLALGLAALLGSARAADPPRGPRVTLVGQGLDLRRAVASLVRAGGYGVAVGPDVAGAVDLALRDEPWAPALARVLGPRGLHAIVHGSVVAVSRRSPASDERELTGASEPAGPEERSPWIGGGAREPRPEETPLPLGLRRPEYPLRAPWQAPRLAPAGVEWRVIPEIRVEDAPLRDVVDQIARTVGYPIAVAADGDERVTLKRGPTAWYDDVAIVASLAHARVRSAGDLLVIERGWRANAVLEDDARRLLHLLAAQAGESLVAGPDASGPVLVELTQDAWDSVLPAIVDAAGLHVVHVGPIAVVASRSLAPVTADPGERWRRRVPGLPRVPWERRGPALDFETGLEVATVVSHVAAHAEIPVVADSSATGTISARLSPLPLDRALGVIAELTRCEPTPVGEKVVVLEPARNVTIQFDDANVRTVLALLAAYAGENVVVFPDCHGDLTVELTHVPWFLALRAVALAANLTACEIAPGITGVSLLAHGPELTEPPDPPRPPAWRRPSDPRRRVTLDLDGADVATVISALADESGVAISGPEPQVSPEGASLPALTLALPAVDWRDALDLVAHETGCEVTREAGGGLRLTRPTFFTFETGRVTAAAWFELLSRTLGHPVDEDPWLAGPDGLDYHGTSPGAVLRATAELVGGDVVPRASGGVRIARRPTTPAAAGQVRFGARPRPSPRPPEPRALSPLEVGFLVHDLEEIVAQLRAAADEERSRAPSPESVDPAREPYASIVAYAGRRVRRDGIRGGELAREQTVHLRERLDAHRELAFAFTLALADAEGQERLEALRRDVRDGRWDDVPIEAHALELHVASLRRRSQREEARRHADALELAGRSLVREATRLAEIQEAFPVHVQAIALDRRPDGRNRAVLSIEGAIPREDVYEEGDALRDWRGAPVPLRVVKIFEGSVRLSCEGSEYVVELDFPS